MVLRKGGRGLFFGGKGRCYVTVRKTIEGIPRRTATWKKNTFKALSIFKIEFFKEGQEWKEKCDL